MGGISGAAPLASEKKRGPTTSVPTVIIHDGSNLEASAAAWILRKMLFHLEFDTSVVVHGEVISASVTTAIILFNAGCLQKPELPSLLLPATRQGSKFLPLVVEEGFRFPSAEMLQDLRDHCPVPERMIGELSGVVASLFHTIAKEFLAQTSHEEELWTLSKEIKNRVSSHGFGDICMSGIRSSDIQLPRARSGIALDSLNESELAESSLRDLRSMATTKLGYLPRQTIIALLLQDGYQQESELIPL